MFLVITLGYCQRLFEASTSTLTILRQVCSGLGAVCVFGGLVDICTDLYNAALIFSHGRGLSCRLHVSSFLAHVLSLSSMGHLLC